MQVAPRKLISLPNRDYWLANAERCDAALDRLAGWMGWIGAATTALLVIATELTVQANLEKRNLDEGTFLFVLAVYFVFVIAWLVQTMRIFRIPEGSAS